MKKINKASILLRCLIAILALGALGFGVYALIQKQQYVKNNINFHVNPLETYVEINGSYLGPTISGAVNYNAKYTESDLVEGVNQYLPSWDIGQVELTKVEPEFTITLEISNLNSQHDLIISISNIAYDGTSDRFFTQCKVDGVPAELLANNGQIIKSANLKNNIVIPKKTAETTSSAQITFTYKLKVYNKIIDNFENNIYIEFSSAD